MRRLGVTLALTVASVASAQIYTVLKNFSGSSDGAYPYAGLVFSGGALYGTTLNGVQMMAWSSVWPFGAD